MTTALPLVDQVALAAFVLSTMLIGYNIIGYPALLRLIGRWLPPQSSRAMPLASRCPTVAIIVPVYNEERWIVRKIENTLALRAPGARRIIFSFDGCTDRSVVLAQAAVAGRDDIELHVHERNRGKIAVLNEEIAGVAADVVMLTDASAMLPADALDRLLPHFADPAVGIVCPTYAGAEPDSAESAYWRIQTRLKAIEGAIAAPIGPHGACYLFRRPLWEPLPADTINDDFVMPMRIVARGHDAVYDASVVAQEIEAGSARIEFRRRLRLGAGNLQQVLRCAGLASLRRPALAFLFLSGKGLRAFVPLLALVAVLSAALLAVRAVPLFGAAGLAALFALLLFLALLLAGQLGAERHLPRPLRLVSYGMTWLVASAGGSLMLLLGGAAGLWKTSNANKGAA
jgi:cellulose synthase/poly-beta-1,6-N-acetylglucosamine synthase-like glycosyltransferase